jgi:hypothetical protein
VVCQAKIPGPGLQRLSAFFNNLKTQRIRLYTIMQTIDTIACGETILSTSHLFASLDYFM